MKIVKNINISSNGSLHFYYGLKTSLNNNKLISFKKQDDKNFILNQKEQKKNIESKHSFYYKKKYLK